MELGDYLKVLRKRWRIVGAALVVAMAAAAALVLTATPQYESHAQLFVSSSGNGDPLSLLQGNSFTQQRVKSYADIVTSPPVLRPVIVQLDLDSTPQQLATQVSAEAPLDTVLINVTVRDPSAAQATAIAAAVASTFSRTVTELERPSGAGTATPVKVSVVREASEPGGPVSPRPVRTVVLLLVLGLAAGLGLALLRELLDTAIKDESDVQAVAQLPILGSIRRDAATSGGRLVVQDAPHSPVAEAFRQLRTNLQFVDIGDHPRSLLITSSVPVEGKSTTTANLVLALAAAGSRTVLVEADLRRPSVAGYLGLEGGAGLTNVLIGQAALDDVLQPWGANPLDVLACGPVPPNPSELLGSSAMAELLRELEQRYDYVILDGPPLLPVTDAAVLSRLVGGTVLVVGVDRSGRDELRRSLEVLNTVGARLLGVVMNFVRPRSTDNEYYTDKQRPELAPRPTGKAHAVPQPATDVPQTAHR